MSYQTSLKKAASRIVVIYNKCIDRNQSIVKCSLTTKEHILMCLGLISAPKKEEQ